LTIEVAELCFGIVFGIYLVSQSAQICSRVVGFSPQKMQSFEARAMAKPTDRYSEIDTPKMKQSVVEHDSEGRTGAIEEKA
jgi:hypothetical protein